MDGNNTRIGSVFDILLIFSITLLVFAGTFRILPWPLSEETVLSLSFGLASVVSFIYAYAVSVAGNKKKIALAALAGAAAAFILFRIHYLSLLFAVYLGMLVMLSFAYGNCRIALFCFPSIMAVVPFAGCSLLGGGRTWAAYCASIGLLAGIKLFYYHPLGRRAEALILKMHDRLGGRKSPCLEADSSDAEAPARVDAGGLPQLQVIEILKINLFIGIARSVGFLLGSTIIVAVIANIVMAGMENLATLSPELSEALQPLVNYVQSQVSSDLKDAVSPLMEYVKHKFISVHGGAR